MIFGKKEKELRDLLEIYKEENKKLKKDYYALNELYEIQANRIKMLCDINSENLGEKFYAIIGITNKTYEPLVYVRGIELKDLTSLNLEYKYMDFPKIDVTY